MPITDLLPILGIAASCTDEGVLQAFLQRAYRAHPEGGGTVTRWLDLVWAYQAALDRAEYSANPAAWQAKNPRPDQVQDWRAWVIGEIHAWLDIDMEGIAERGATRADGLPLSANEVRELRMPKVTPWTDHLPLSWDMDRVGWFAGQPDVLDVRSDLDALLRLPEFDRLREGTFQVIYRVKARKKAGQEVLACVRPISAGDRETWPTQPAPLFRLEIAWPWWTAMASWTSPRGFRELRYRLLHHELGHLMVMDTKKGPVGRSLGHDMEEFGATLQRYGAAGWTQAAIIHQAYHHPITQAHLRTLPPELHTFLTERDLNSLRVEPRIIPSPAAFAREVAQSRAKIVELQAMRHDVDFGHAPWEEALALLEVLGTVSAPSSDDVIRLEVVRGMFRRFSPYTVLE